MSDIIQYGKPIKQVGEGAVKEPLRLPFKYDPRSGLLSLEEGVNTDFAIKNGFKNSIINGDFQIWQRGTSFSAAADGTYSADRFRYNKVGAGVATLSQSTDTPDTTSLWSLKVDVTTADTSIAAGDFQVITQFIEGYDVRKYIGKTFALSFYVKSPKSGIHCVRFANLGADRSFVVEYTVNAPNTWEKKTVTVDGGLITSGTWDWTNGAGLRVTWCLMAGTTFQTTANAWQTGNFYATANQVNCFDSTANDFYLSQVQLELGEVATEFERRPIGVELELCQRYYYRWIATQTTTYLATLQAVSATGAFGKVLDLPVDMRIEPTVTYSAGANFYLHTPAGSSAGTLTSQDWAQSSVRFIAINTTIGGGLTAGNATGLGCNSASAFIACDADF